MDPRQIYALDTRGVHPTRGARSRSPYQLSLPPTASTKAKYHPPLIIASSRINSPHSFSYSCILQLPSAPHLTTTLVFFNSPHSSPILPNRVRARGAYRSNSIGAARARSTDFETKNLKCNGCYARMHGAGTGTGVRLQQYRPSTRTAFGQGTTTSWQGRPWRLQ